MEADWDLHAVVRGSSSAPISYSHPLYQVHPTRVSLSGLFQFQTDQESLPFDCQPQLDATTRSVFDQLHGLYYDPSFRKPQPVCSKNVPLSTSSSLSSLVSSLLERTKSYPSSFGKLQRPSPSPGFGPASQTSKSKKRKNTLKKVCEVPAESFPSDVWAWRKYGQKPIKGSPFPRSYYRCSSSKGCLARKQVERNRSDPGMFIVTFTAEHNHPAPTHRNSLAGVTRQKQTSPTSTPLSEITNSDSNVRVNSCSSPNASHDSPDDEKEDRIQEHEMEGEGLMNDMFPSDDFFLGLEGFMGGGGGSGDKAEEEDRWDPRQTSFSFPWTANNTAAAASGR